MQIFRFCTALKKVQLADIIKDENPPDWDRVQLPRLWHLEELSITAGPFMHDPAFVLLAISCPKLKSLTLGGVSVTARGFYDGLSHLPNLRALCLQDTTINLTHRVRYLFLNFSLMTPVFEESNAGKTCLRNH